MNEYISAAVTVKGIVKGSDTVAALSF